jgi:DNA-binding PadR family transcriptional regulator
VKKLTINEQIFLIAIWHLENEAYGVRIREKIKELTGNDMLFGTIYNTLEYLVRKDYVVASKKMSSDEKPDHKRVYYRITRDGLNALRDAKKLQENLWKEIPDFALREAKK